MKPGQSGAVLITAVVVIAIVAAVAQDARAQMPDLRSMSGRPLPVPDLAPGTVTVRVVRQNPANAAVGVDVIAKVSYPAGDVKMTMVKTGADGRAQFEGLPPNSQFQATVTVDGEKLTTQPFPLPPQGGIRVMLISGLGAAPAGAGGHAPQAEPAPPGAGVGTAAGQPARAPGQTFRMGAPTGAVEPAPDLPKGTLVLEVRGANGQPLGGKAVRLGEIRMNEDKGGRDVKVHDAVASSAGQVRWDGLTTGETAGYAAVTEHEGMRLSTQPFRMPVDTGMRGRILALGRTNDPSVLTLDGQTKMVFDLREEAVAVMIGLTFRNPSQKIFDPGDQGLVIKLPPGAVNAQEIEGGEPLDIVPGQLVRLKSPIPPDAAAQYGTQVRFGYILPTDGAGEMEITQQFPVSWPDPFIIVPEKTGLSLSGLGLKPLTGEVDGTGDKVRAYTVTPVAPGATLTLSVAGIPARDRTGRTVAAVLCLLLIGAALVFARPAGGKSAAARADRDTLIARREELFAELVALEEQRKGSAQASSRLGDRRKEIIVKLEVVYRDLAALDHH